MNIGDLFTIKLGLFIRSFKHYQHNYREDIRRLNFNDVFIVLEIREHDTYKILTSDGVRYVYVEAEYATERMC